MTVQAGVHAILEQVRRGELDPAAARQLNRVEADAPRHSRWPVILMLSAAAASLAGLLGADLGAALVAGVATGVGLAARQELGRRHASPLALPFVAGLIGAIFGGVAIRLGLDANAGTGADRAVADRGAGAALYQRALGSVRQLRADGRFSVGLAAAI